MIRSAGERMAVLVQDGDVSVAKAAGEIVDMFAGFGVKREVVEPRMAPVVGCFSEPLFDSNQYEVGGSEPPRPSVVPRLVRLVAQFLQQPRPELERRVEVGGLQLDVVEVAGSIVVDRRHTVSGPPFAIVRSVVLPRHKSLR
ncbi:hypothetical protein ACFQMM_11320 [Saliphagus sp. GCM10025308]